MVFTPASEMPTHEGGFEGMPLGERAGIETAEQAVRAVMLAQSRGAGQLPPEERTPLPPPPPATVTAEALAAAEQRLAQRLGQPAQGGARGGAARREARGASEDEQPRRRPARRVGVGIRTRVGVWARTSSRLGAGLQLRALVS